MDDKQYILKYSALKQLIVFGIRNVPEYNAHDDLMKIFRKSSVKYWISMLPDDEKTMIENDVKTVGMSEFPQSTRDLEDLFNRIRL